MSGRIIRQAIEYVGDITRAWSEWDDGTITHSDTRSVPRATPEGFVFHNFQFVNIGADRDMRPPPGLTWVETSTVKDVDHG